MDYERIRKVQMQLGVISPTKLKMKLLGSQGGRKREVGNNSSRASPSKLDDMEHSRRSLLAGDLVEEDIMKDPKDGLTLSTNATSESSELRSGAGSKNQNDHGDDSDKLREQIDSLNTENPIKCREEDSNGNESGQDNVSTSSFEFQRGERTLQHPVIGPFIRHAPSKWNDAEKWIINRNRTHSNPVATKKTIPQSPKSRQVISNCVRVAPEALSNAEQKHQLLQVADAKSSPSGKCSFDPNSTRAGSESANATSGLTDLSPVSGDSGSATGPRKGLNHKKLSIPGISTGGPKVTSVESVLMKDAGTEMTPIGSQEASRIGTPIGPVTPVLSPLCSMPSTPKRGGEESGRQKKGGPAELSDRELQLRTRREIAALGLQLGKMNIASWASKENTEISFQPDEIVDAEQNARKENETRAAEWEESQRSKHVARYKHEEFKIQEWESRRKAKFEAEVKRIEAEAEQMKARAQLKMAEKLAVTRRRAERKQAIAEARRSRRAARTAKQAERIRQTGRAPSPRILGCCSWFL